MSELYRLVYASRNLLAGSEDEAAEAVMQILTTSQRNNAAVGVTGALLFNKGAFAQVLEGPRRFVEDTFERIQQDDRHGDVTVLQCGPADVRGFADWSMAFVGRSQRGQALWAELAAQSGFELSRLNGDAVYSMLHDLVADEEGIISAPPIDFAIAPAHQASVTLDVAKLRTELAEIRPAGPTVADTAGNAVTSQLGSSANTMQGEEETALATLKNIIQGERLAAVALRAEIDDLRVALACSVKQVERQLQQRGAWAERVHSFATSICSEADAILASFPSATVPAPDVSAQEVLHSAEGLGNTSSFEHALPGFFATARAAS